MTKNIHVPYGLSVHGQEEIDAVIEVLKTSTQMGARTRRLEERIAAMFDKKHGIMVNSGTSALYLAVEALGIPAGAEVITPALTFSSTVSCLVKNGLIPAFVDVAPNTFCIDTAQMEEMLSDKTTAVLAPNLIGNVCEWEAIHTFCQKHGLLIIEDSADTLGATLNGRSSGAWSDASITSFYGSHIINGAGNGGMLCLNDDGAADQSRLLRSWGRNSSLFKDSEKIEDRFNVELDGIPYDAKFVFAVPGYQLEPSEISAAFALVQLGKLEDNMRAREENFARLTEFFGNYEAYFALPQQTPNTRTNWLAYPLVIRDDAPFTRRDMQIFLEQRNIQTRVIFTGNILRQPGFKNISARVRGGGLSGSRSGDARRCLIGLSSRHHWRDALACFSDYCNIFIPMQITNDAFYRTLFARRVYH